MISNLKSQRQTGNWQKIKNHLEIVTIRSLEEIEEIRPIWERMQRNQAFPIINADVDRYLSVLKSQKGQNIRPHVILLNRDGHPEAMVIGHIGKHHLRREKLF